MIRLGIVGLPNVGKSTLFNALTRSHAAASNYPFCTVEPNVGIVPVPDPRLDRLVELVKPPKVVPATVEFFDIAGLVEGASQGEGLGNQFLGHIREVDAIVHVIRCFEDPEVTHVTGGVHPAHDHDIVTAELALADLGTVERRLEKVNKLARSGDKVAQRESALLQKVEAELNQGRGARDAVDSAEERRLLRQLGLLTLKPILYAANVSETELSTGTSPWIDELESTIRRHHEEAEVVSFAAKFEAELLELDPEEQRGFLDSVGITEPGLNRVIRAGYRLLGLETFFTIGDTEVRAWTVKEGTMAYEAAGEIHSDFQRGFIRAETIGWDEFIQAGSYKTARESGLVRSEGRDYRVKDGDILLFRFNV